MKRIWIVTELFYPEETSTAYILTIIAQKLTEKYEVYVITGSASLDKEEIECNNIKVFRVRNFNLDKNKLLTRLIRFILLSIQISFSLLCKLKKEDKVLVVTNPALLLLLVSLIKKIKGNTLYILVHDVFPENLIPSHILTSSKTFIYKILKICFDQAYKEADLLIAIGRDMKALLQEKISGRRCVSSIEIIENWAESSLIQKNMKETVISNKKTTIEIQYAGNLGRVQGLMELLDIIASINNRKLNFSFWGNGAIKNKMFDFVREKCIQNVTFCGPYKRSEQWNILSSCDIAIVTLSEGMYGLGVPSKSYNIMAVGKPILFIGDLQSEIALLIKEHDIGYCFDAKDRDGIRNFLLRLDLDQLFFLKEKGLKARRLVEDNFSEAKILDKYIQIL